MALGNICFLFFTALVAVNIIFADDSLLSDASDADQIDLTESVSRQTRQALTPCNYTATPGSYCASCRQAVRCLRNGNGIVRRCGGFLPYCNGGRCSFTAGPACNGTTTG